MGMQSMYELREMLCRELDELTRKGELGAGDLDIAHKLTDTIKNIDKIDRLEDEGYSRGMDYSRGRYSRDGNWEADMRGTYNRGNSYERQGTHYVRGHYSRDGYSNRGRESGYSRHDAKEQMMAQLEDMMGSVSNEREREAIRRCMEQLDRE